MYLVHEKCALISSFPEMMDSIKKIIGVNERTNRFYAGEYEFKITTSDVFVKKTKYHPTNQALIFVNSFFLLGGIEKILSLMDWCSLEK